MPFRPIENAPASRSYVSPRARTRSAVSTPEVPPSDAPGEMPARREHRAPEVRTGPNWDDEGNYLVGKGRPPKNTRWIEGQSGNPRGPVKREPLSAQARYEQALLTPFTATVNGEAISLTMDVFAVQTLKTAAAKGSVKAATILLDLFSGIIKKRAEQDPGPQAEQWEQEAVNRLLAELNIPERPVVRQTDRSDDRDE